MYRLVALSLVKSDGDRYSFHPLLRAFAQEELENSTPYLRMAEYFLEFAKERINDFNGLELDRANILSAIDWSYEHKNWQMVIDLTAAMLGPNAYYGFLAQRGYWDESIARAQQALGASRRLGDLAGEARFSQDLGLFHYWLGENEKARSFYQVSQERFRDLGDKRGLIVTLHRLGYIEDDEDNYPKAREYYERSLGLSQEIGDEKLVTLSHHLVGVVAYHQGYYNEARSCFEQSLSESLARGDEAAVARTRRRFAAVARMQGHYADPPRRYKYFDEARRLLTDSLKVETNLRGRARALRQLGMLAQEEGDTVQAREYFEQSLELFQRLDNKKGVAATLYNMASIYQEAGNIAEAERLYKESLAMAQPLKCRYGEAITLRQLGSIALSRGELDKANELLMRSVDTLERIQSPHLQSAKDLLQQVKRQRSNHST
jgi:tetratricopeptide (TPR) repeat protein